MVVGAAAPGGSGWLDIEVDVGASDAGVDFCCSSTWRNCVEIWCREEVLFPANVYSDIYVFGLWHWSAISIVGSGVVSRWNRCVMERR